MISIVQTTLAQRTSTNTTLTATLTNDPTPGNFVIIGIACSPAISSFTIADSNSNSYSFTSGSPSTTGGVQCYIAYLLSAPGNATKTINFAWTTAAVMDAYVSEFTGGTFAFDLDAAGGSGSSSTTINTPTVTPSGASEFVYAFANSQGSISAPTSGGTLGIWTGVGAAPSSQGSMAEYILSQSSAAQAQFTSSSNPWSSIGAAFTVGTINPGDMTPGSEVRWEI